MKAKDIKLLIQHIDDDFKLCIKCDGGLIDIKNFELNIKDGYIVFNK
ncbi:TPA: hypothetical protein ACF2DE_002833 [Clostridium perfringens]